jgi:hypothetical protein
VLIIEPIQYGLNHIEIIGKIARYYVNVERGDAADKLNGRICYDSFTNTFNLPIEVMIFIFYSDEITIDAGLVTRHKK